MTSIVMTTYRRVPLLRNTLGSIVRQYPNGEPMPEVIVVEDGDDGGATRRLCEDYQVTYLQRKDRPDLVWSNPSVPANIGLRHASGDIVIFQGSDVMHTGNLVRELTAKVKDDNAVFASVMAMTSDWHDDRWYTHSQYRAAPFFFCGAMKRKWFHELRGLDEDFKLGAYDDTDFACRLEKAGVRFEYADDVLAYHQWHTPNLGLAHDDYLLFNDKRQKLLAGEIGVERNLDHEWGTR